MDHDETIERARRFTDALHALDRDADALDGMLELFAEEAELSNAATELIGEGGFRGRDGARTFWSEYREQFAEAETEFRHVTAGENSAGLFWSTRGKAASGESLNYVGATLLVFDDAGLVERFHGYYDTRQLVVSELAKD